MNTEKLKIYENHYFKLNKWFLDFTGLWPFSNTVLTFIKQIFIAGLLLVASLPNAAGAHKFCGIDRTLCSENVTGSLLFFSSTLKYTVTLANRKRMRKVFEFVSTNWIAIEDPDEREIMNELAKQGRKWTLAYSTYAIGGAIIFSQFSLIPPFLDLIIPLNESRQKILVTNAAYGFDPYEHFYQLYFGYIILGIAISTTAVAIDTTYNVVVHQCIGTLQIVRFIEIIESANNLCFLLLLGTTIVGLSIGTIAIVETIHTPLIASKFIVLAFAIYMHLLYLTLPGQKVIDASSDLFRNLYMNKWYNMNEKPKTLLKIMMMRCSKPLVLTAGGLYVMNFQNTGMVVKTAMSYFTVLISVT